MFDWEFEVTGKIVVRAHCQDDAAYLVADLAEEFFSGDFSVDLSQVNGRIRVIK